MNLLIKVNDEIELSSVSEEDSKEIFKIIDSQRAYLREWMAWVDSTVREDDIKKFYQFCETQQKENKGFHYVIKYKNIVIGQIGIRSINHQNKSTSIGYWLSQEYQGKGIMLASCRAIINHCFLKLDIHRIEIRCAVNNIKSNKIPVALFCIKEGVLRESELLNGKFIDFNVYSILKNEWLNHSKK